MRNRSLATKALGASVGVFLASTLSMGPASAQSTDDGVTLDPFRAAELGTDGFAVARPITLLPRTYSARLTLDYGRNSLVFDAPGTANDYTVVRNHLVGTIGVAFAASSRVTVGVGLPVNLWMTGDAPPVAGIGLAERDKFVLAGDPYVSGRVRILGEQGDTFVLGAQLRLTLPIADAGSAGQRYSGDQSPTVTPAVLGELTFDRLRLNGMLGGRFRGVERQRDLTVGQELVYALGVTYGVIEDTFDITGEAYGSTDLRAFGASSGSPLEVLAGVRWHANSDWNLGGAIGTRLTQGYGASDMRAVLSVGYAPTVVAVVAPPEPAVVDTDADDDGIPDETDACDDQAEDADEFEDADGCPDPDNDHDGVLDADDSDPNGAEDVDGFEDADGRPDPDNDGDGVPDADDRCPIEAEDRDGLADADGCPETDVDGDSVPDADDHCPMTPGAANATNPECGGCPASACIDASGTIRILQRIEFENGRDVIRPASLPVLESVQAILSTTDSIRRVRIEGHTDDRGNDAANLELSARRAAAVRTWLVEHGIAEGRLESAGLGETRPVADNRTAQGRSANRRVEFHIVDPAPATP